MAGKPQVLRSKSLGLTILWWAEIVVGARTLLFFVPVMINKCLMKSFLPAVIEDRFIAGVSLTALLYFIVGIVSLSGSKLWRLFHYLAAALTVFWTVGLYNVMVHTRTPPAWEYFVPTLVAVVTTLSVCSLKACR